MGLTIAAKFAIGQFQTVPVRPPTPEPTHDDALPRALPDRFFTEEVTVLARALLGCLLSLDGVGGRIVETEAYEPSEPASHAFKGPTARNAVMFGSPGRAYVYRIYGAHWCLNVVGGAGAGSAVLIRSLEPIHGVDVMLARRGPAAAKHLCDGPGRLCQALGVTNAHNGLSLTEAPFSLLPGSAPEGILFGPRIGISKAVELPWRFGVRGSPALSRPFPR